MKKSIIKVEFYWVDSERQDGWHYIDSDEDNPDNLKSSLCYTDGILLSENAKFIKVTSTLAENQRLSPLTVPKVAIVGKIKKTKKFIDLKV
jgi:hypothetical protein